MRRPLYAKVDDFLIYFGTISGHLSSGQFITWFIEIDFKRIVF